MVMNSTSNGLSADLLRDLAESSLLQLEEDERIWKLYIFRPEAGRTTHLEHRIYSKLKADGRLSLVTFAVHTPSAGKQTRSAVARVPDLSVDALDQIIERIRQETNTGSSEYEEMDLSHLDTVAEQLEYLRTQGEVDNR